MRRQHTRSLATGLHVLQCLGDKSRIPTLEEHEQLQRCRTHRAASARENDAGTGEKTLHFVRNGPNPPNTHVIGLLLVSSRPENLRRKRERVFIARFFCTTTLKPHLRVRLCCTEGCLAAFQHFGHACRKMGRRYDFCVEQYSP